MVNSNLDFKTTITIPAPGDYQLEDWYIAARDPQSITFRPSLKTLLGRLAITLVAAIVVGVLAALKDTLTSLGALPEGGDAIATVIDAGIWLLMGFAGLVGILSPLSTLWQKLTVSRGVRGTLRIKASRILGSTREWPLEALRTIGVIVQERVVRPARGPQQHLGYLWRVGVVGNDGQWCVDLHIDREKSTPLEGRLSDRTRQCVEALQQITGLPYSGSPVLIEDGFEPRVMDKPPDIMPGATQITERSGNITRHVSTSTSSKTYHSLDEMPPDMRARVEAMMAQGRNSDVESFVSEQITITDEHGNTRTYKSVEEMPPDVRARYEEARRKFME
jgi:hypothetical protein